jgi:uncharacterized damage-inducible protein DinB
MYHTIQDFLDDWKFESGATWKVFKNLTDASLSQKVTPDGRSLGFLAWHITLTLGEMGGKAGLKINGPEEHEPLPSSASAIASAYETSAQSVASEVKARWTDAALAEKIDMYGEQWTRSETLASLVKHQIHHRAQMTALMRQAGLKVPGIYGPSREEWAQFGMSAPQ